MPIVLVATLYNGHLWAVAITLVTVLVCILMHYEVSMRLWQRLETSRRSLRARFLMLSFVLFATHVAQIWLFAVALALLGHHP